MSVHRYRLVEDVPVDLPRRLMAQFSLPNVDPTMPSLRHAQSKAALHSPAIDQMDCN